MLNFNIFTPRIERDSEFYDGDKDQDRDTANNTEN